MMVLNVFGYALATRKRKTPGNRPIKFIVEILHWRGLHEAFEVIRQ